MTKLADPMASYCAGMGKIVNKYIRTSNEIWYKLFRKMGCTAVESLSMARFSTQEDVNKFDLSVNFDGPMI